MHICPYGAYNVNRAALSFCIHWCLKKKRGLKFYENVSPLGHIISKLSPDLYLLNCAVGIGSESNVLVLKNMWDLFSCGFTDYAGANEYRMCQQIFYKWPAHQSQMSMFKFDWLFNIIYPLNWRTTEGQFQSDTLKEAYNCLYSYTLKGFEDCVTDVLDCVL